MIFVIKIILSATIIAFASWLSGRKPVLAGFIIALPIVSMLSIFLSYFEYRDMKKTNEFAVSIITALPLSLTFFLPFFLNRWLKMNFALTYSLAVGSVALGYLAYNWATKGALFR